MSAPASRTRRAIEITIAVAALVGILLWMSGAFHTKVGPGDAATGRAAGPAAGAPVAPVAASGPTVAVRVVEIADEVEAVGTVEALARAQVGAQVPGVVQEVRVRPGAAVVTGQVLAVIAAPEIQAQELQADGARAAAGAQALQAARDADRAAKLYEAGAIARVEMERMQTAHALAIAAETSATGAVRVARAVSGYRTVKSPVSGVIAARLVEPGDLVGPGRPLFTFEDTGVYRFVARIPEHRRGALSLGDSVMILLEGDAAPRRASLTEIVPALDPVTRTVTVRVTLPADVTLRSGLFGRLVFAAGTRRALVVPEAAVERAGTLDLVRVASAGAAPRTRYVRLGARLGARIGEGPDALVEVLSGLDEGEVIVVPATSSASGAASRLPAARPSADR